MAAPVVQASSEKLRQLAELRAQKAALDAKLLSELDVFAILGYEPTCMRRVVARKAAAKELGFLDWTDSRIAEAVALPEPCGECPQELFHAATEWDVLYGGAAGGGKSHAITAEGIKWCARYPGLRALLIRRSYDELEESIFPALRKLGFAQALGCRWNKVTRELSFPNGSVFRFRYLETVDDAARRHGGEYQLVCADELTLQAPGLLDFLRYERIRAAGNLPIIGVRATSNPGGPSHGEVKKRYIEPTDFGRKVVKDDHGLTIRFIQAKSTDNPWLDPGYQARLDSIPDPARRAAMRDGDWNQFSGAVFPQFDRERHIVEPFTIPNSWRLYAGVDWGYTAPFCVAWAAVDEDSRVWFYREIYETHVGEADQAKLVLEAEAGETIIARWADDSIWATRGDAKPIATIWAENGVHLTPAGKGPGSRIAGIQRWHSYLADGPACLQHRSQGLEVCPQVHFLAGRCPKLTWEIENLPYAINSHGGFAEDSDPRAPDHGIDASKYLLINLGGGAQFFVSPEAPQPGTAELLTPMGQWAVREDPNAPVSTDPDKPKAGLTQTWEQAMAAARPGS